MHSFAVSCFTASSPARLSKGMKIGPDGTIIKQTGGNLVEGRVETLAFTSIADFAAFLPTLTPRNALAHGLCPYPAARVVMQTQVEASSNAGLPVIARTREHFQFPAGTAVLMIDYDPRKDGSMPLTPKELRELLISVWPALAVAPHVVCNSASSHIYNNGTQVIGQRGLRIYVLVAEGTDIPRTGAALFNRLVLAGLGHIEISKSGQMLLRSIADAAVWQPERLDFVGGCHCAPPLRQERPDPQVFNAGASPVDTKTSMHDLCTSEKGKLQKLVEALKANARSETETIREAWIEAQTMRRATAENVDPEIDPARFEEIRETFKSATTRRCLFGDFVLHAENGQTVTVGEVLDDPNKWHGTRFADPLEPDYGNDERISWLNLRTPGKPTLYSHAHGGLKYVLTRARRVIRLMAGERVDAVHKTLEQFRLDGQLYVRGKEMVRVTHDGDICPLDVAGILFEMDRVCSYEKIVARKGDYGPCDAPRAVAEGIAAKKGDWPLPSLDAVLTSPTLDPRTMRVLDMPGYDAKTKLLLLMSEESVKRWSGVPASPTREQVRAALELIWTPFRAFPFQGAVDRGVMLAAVLTTLVRPSLPTAPGFAFGAPTAGSGKTLLSKCLARLAGLAMPAVLAGAKEDEEMRKRLLALGRSGARVIILDNLAGIIASEALCAWLTSEVFTDRVLGISVNASVPTRAMLLLTGNNLTLKGDLCRRILTCRIDPEMETPWRRKFDLNPAEWCREHRLEMVAAGLTIIRAAAQSPPLTDRTASFEEWSDSIRKAVCNIADEGLMDVKDPTLSIDSSYDDDPETAKLKSMLAVWNYAVGDKPTTVAEIKRLAETGGHGCGVAVHAFNHLELRNVLDEIAGERGVVNVRRLGRWIERNAGRIVDGLRFEKAGTAHKTALWRVRQVAGGV